MANQHRPNRVQAVIERVRTGHGDMYVTVGFDSEGRPFELFSTLGKAGGCHAAQLEAIWRLISLALQEGIDPVQIVDQLRGITCCPVWDNGVLVRSDGDAMALVLSRSLSREGWVPTKDFVVQLSLFSGARLTVGSPCPLCSTPLIQQEGCLRCPPCGYTNCT